MRLGYGDAGNPGLNNPDSPLTGLARSATFFKTIPRYCRSFYNSARRET
jgi:hypothetical protein